MILVCGGAGYIGSHMVKTLVEKGESVAVLDNLQNGHRAAVAPEAQFFQGDVRHEADLDEALAQGVTDVIHFAADALVGESVQDPLKYYDNNVYGLEVLLKAMVRHKVPRIVFSSSAATYGEPKKIPIEETDPTCPTNPYGETKLAMEKMMKWVENAHGVRFVSLRYFNVAGAWPDGSLGEDHSPETHLIPLVLRVPLGQAPQINIFGDDYATKDGTCLRDYVHVCDLAQAHLLALEHLRHGEASGIFNLGSAQGFTVKEIIEAAERVTGQKIKSEVKPRRAGDPARLVADSTKARTVLKWRPRYDDVEDIIGTAWTWHQKHPQGWGDR